MGLTASSHTWDHCVEGYSGIIRVMQCTECLQSYLFFNSFFKFYFVLYAYVEQ